MNRKIPTAPLNYLRDHREHILEELIAWCKIPSISSLAEYQPDIQAAAGFGAQLLRSAGLQNVAILPTSGHPVVYGEWLEAGEGAPTVLLYGHYDVQPALEPDQWNSPPFEPSVKDERLFARGASDMKGQTLAEIKAIQAVLKTEGKLPVNIKFIIEGEEEIGSRNLRAFIQQHKEKLACDYAFNPDAGMCAIDQPSITYSLRGGVRIDLTVYGPQTDVHSGVFGGAIHNPALALSELIAGMYDAHGRVTLPGFYDDVQPLDQEERSLLARLPVNDEFFLTATQAPALWGDPNFTAFERTAARPSLEVLAFHAGLSGEGVLNIVPAKASAALSMRLVPDQDPQHCYQGLMRYLEQKAPPTIRWEAKYIAGGRGVLVSRKSHAVQALYRALQATWDVEPLFSRQGGGIPVVGQLQQELGIDSILTGFGLPTDNIHGPNEHLHLPTWYLGMQALVRFFYEA
jgi:acetylornithine deacetylase/succinyl-diaminopimelate desuccinylase-like protein